MVGLPIWLIGALLGLVVGFGMVWLVTARMGPAIEEASGEAAERARAVLGRYRIVAPLAFAVAGALLAVGFFGEPI